MNDDLIIDLLIDEWSISSFFEHVFIDRIIVGVGIDDETMRRSMYR